MFDINLLSAMAVLVGVLALSGVAWHKRDAGLQAARQIWKARPPKRISVEDRIALTPQHTLHVVRFENRTLLIATTPVNLVVLDAAKEGGPRLRNPERLPEEVFK
ncbi:MAG: flagellar biosynthetic protein FliO [Fimbriimonadaceae bacterium]|nr:flagellar biosynthetic protein FliO [Fimbriimonadaceae bacterium]